LGIRDQRWAQAKGEARSLGKYLSQRGAQNKRTTRYGIRVLSTECWVSADPSATPRVDVEEGQSQTSMDISPSTETSRLEEVVSLTGSYQRIRWGSKVDTKDEPGVPDIEIILRKLFASFLCHLQLSFRGRFARTGFTEGNVV